MNLTKDMYEYLTNFADDRDILNMLSVDKKFSNDEFFRKVLERKYPLLLKFKKENETHKKFYLKLIFYMSKLKTEFNIPYGSWTVDPESFYNTYYKYRGILKLVDSS